MKNFEAPELEIISFKVDDILTTSNDLPFTPYAINEDELEIARID